jgi:hypothetical protein
MALHPVHPWIDVANAPVYHLTYPAYDPQDVEQLAKYNREQQELYDTLAEWTAKTRRAFAFVIDLSNVNSLAMNRQRAIAYLERVKKRGNPFMAGRAFVTPNSHVRGVMTAVFWQSPPDYPHAFFETVEAAMVWAREQVEEHARVMLVGSTKG